MKQYNIFGFIDYVELIENEFKVIHKEMKAQHPKRKEIESIDLIELMKTKNIKEISEMYDCSVFLVNSIAKKRFAALRINKNEINKEKYPLSVSDLEEFSNKDFINSIGAWKNSKERKSIKEYKQTNK